MSETSTQPATAPRRTGVELRQPDTGTLFPKRNDPIEFEGAIRIGDITFDVTTTRRQSRNGKDYYALNGIARDDSGRTLVGALFEKPAATGANGKPKPSFTGDCTMKPGGEKKELAAWDMEAQKTGNPYLSLRVSAPRAANSSQ